MSYLMLSHLMFSFLLLTLFAFTLRQFRWLKITGDEQTSKQSLKMFYSIGLYAFIYFLLIIFGAGWQPGLAATVQGAIAMQALLLSCFIIFHQDKAITDNSYLSLIWLFTPYAVLIGLSGLVLSLFTPPIAAAVATDLNGILISLHIIGAVTGYSLLALAALAALGVLIKRHALKSKRMSQGFLLNYFHHLPALQEGIYLQQFFLKWSVWVLLLGILSGATLNWYHHGSLFQLNHKIILTLFGFAMAGLLYILDRWLGIGGKRVAVIALIIFLTFSLAYPGVKLVQEFILS